MIKDSNQNQEAGDGSTNLQGQTITIHQGISYSDAKQIALDVYRSNFMQLSQDAAKLARERAEELTDDFLAQLSKTNSAAVDELRTPSMQAAIFEAQKHYAKTGDKDLEELLVDILVERASATERNIRQIVLDESLAVAPKLTPEQMDALTVNFLLAKTKKQLGNLPALTSYFHEDILPFLDGLRATSSCYEHLAYTGCGAIVHVGGIKPVEELMRINYAGLFSNGFTIEKFEAEIGPQLDYQSVLLSCLHDQSKLQLNAIDEDVLVKAVENNGYSSSKDKIMSLFKSSIMTQAEAKNYIISVCPGMEKLFDLWRDSLISKFSLTTVGIAIAQANFRRRTGVRLDLGIWVS